MNLIRFDHFVIHFTLFLLHLRARKATDNEDNPTKQLASELTKKCLWLLGNVSSQEEVKLLLDTKDQLNMSKDEFCEKYPIWDYKMAEFRESVSYVISLLENTTNLYAAEMGKKNTNSDQTRTKIVENPTNVTKRIQTDEQVVQLMGMIDTLINAPREQFYNVYPSLQHNLRILFVETANQCLSLFYDRIIARDTYEEEKNKMPLLRLSKLFNICVRLLRNIPPNEKVKQLMDTIQNTNVTTDQFYNDSQSSSNTLKQLITMIDVAFSLMDIRVDNNTETTNATAIASPLYDFSMVHKVKEMRKGWKWIFENKQSEKEIKQLTNILDKLNITTKEFIRVVPQIKYQISDETYENLKKSKFKENFNRDKIIQAIKSPDYLIKDKSRLIVMLAVLRMPEGILHRSDEEWVRNLEQ